MNKFKIGDEVMRVDCDNEAHDWVLKVGTVCEVINIDYQGWLYVKTDGVPEYEAHDPQYFELVEPKRKKRSELVVGDKVKIRKKAEKIDESLEFYCVGWEKEMDEYLGREATIISISQRTTDWIYLDIDGGEWIWHRKMLKHVPE